MSRKRAIPEVKPKLDPETPVKLKLLKTISPKTTNQEDYLSSVIHNFITIISGPAGCGKSYLAIGLACEHLVEGKTEKILVCRSIVGCGKELGFLPGKLSEKILPYFYSYIEYFNFFLGVTVTKDLIKKGIISFQPVEIIRGQTHNDSFIIADESQNLTKKQLKLLMSRFGQNSKMIIAGDSTQADIFDSGFPFILEKMTKLYGLEIVELDKGDIQRHAIIPHILEIFDNG